MAAKTDTVDDLRSLAGFLREVTSITDIKINGRDAPLPLALAEMMDGVATELEKTRWQRDDAVKHLREAAPTLRSVAEKAEFATRLARRIEDDLMLADSAGKEGPWVVVIGTPGPGALYYAGHMDRQTSELDSAEQFEKFQQGMRSFFGYRGDRISCITLEEARTAIAKAKP